MALVVSRSNYEGVWNVETPFIPWHDFMCFIKGIVHPKMKILSSFTLPQVDPNLYECVCSAEHKGRYFEESL